MHSVGQIFATILAISATLVSAKPRHDDSITFGPTIYASGKQDIIKFVTTTYPGAIPSNQKGNGLFLWPGLTNSTGDLIQSVVGSYPPGASECSGANVNTEWCISSEVYGLDASGNTNQFVGQLTTLDATPSNGLKITYTLTDPSAYTWTQVVTDAVTGKEMATYTKNSGPMTIFEASVECQDCSPTIADQTYVNTTITFAEADKTWSSVPEAESGATFTTPTTSDGGVTWTIAKITFPAES
ncbi:hypothetical protein EV356DRAFT_575393 [Viridothelium virens]|uniref:Concanavalin A-like lectin/glucanase n=1 Tax=Viridothelium virens TaxID=1048519 RepID=A0A6A6HDF4_VIRVR|nr:hypothetical protein EV356DRAFT_575393 [Viridothelium virens]